MPSFSSQVAHDHLHPYPKVIALNKTSSCKNREGEESQNIRCQLDPTISTSVLAIERGRVDGRNTRNRHAHLNFLQATRRQLTALNPGYPAYTDRCAS